MLQAFSWEVSIAGGETLSALALDVIPIFSASPYWLARASTPEIGGAYGAGHWAGQVMVPPRWTPRVTIDKSGAVQVATYELALFGMLIPVGNIQRI